jgi:hypothetical protein
MLRLQSMYLGRGLDRAKDEQGAALLEFAVALPLLVVFVVGIYDFSGAFNQKQKLEQAAQEGAILAGAQPMSDLSTSSGSNPASLQAVVTTIYNSLVGSGVVPAGTCSPPGTPTGPAGLTWIYTIHGCNTAPPNNDLVITINRGWVCGYAGPACNPSTPPTAIGTAVKVQYTYIWRFNSVIQSLIPGAIYAPTTQLTASATVHNQM